MSFKLNAEQREAIASLFKDGVLTYYGTKNVSLPVSLTYDSLLFYHHVRGILHDMAMDSNGSDGSYDGHPLLVYMSPQIKELFLTSKRYRYKETRQKKVLELLRILCENPDDEKAVELFHSRSTDRTDRNGNGNENVKWIVDRFTNLDNKLIENKKFKELFRIFSFVYNLTNYFSNFSEFKNFFSMYPHYYQELYDLLNHISEIYLEKNKKLITALNVFTNEGTDSLTEFMKHCEGEAEKVEKV